jgi:Fe-S oxidoreductase
MAITGQLGFEGFTDPHIHEVLDLCLECKACKSECPTNVDMARLKAEFLDQYSQRHGVRWRSRLFGHVDMLGRIGCATAPVSSWLLQTQAARWIQHKCLGIERRRVSPAFARRTLLERFEALQTKAGHAAPDLSAGHKSHDPGPDPAVERRSYDGAQRLSIGLASSQPVLLFPDTFTNFFEPHVGASAIAVLQRVGCSVVLGPRGLRCCGRPLISNGMLKEAVANARHNVERLYDWARQGRPITTCEPSCILTMKDDYPALLKRELRSQAETVAGVCFTIEELLASRLESASLERPPRHSTARQILVQPHCHQRSLVGTAPLLALLRLIPGVEITILDAGCCGMAGSFGYEVEHYDISRTVGEQRLFPALREADPDAVIVAPGFSCRLQIQHFTGRAALHPAELLRSWLA